jgi:hypothetical protein
MKIFSGLARAFAIKIIDDGASKATSSALSLWERAGAGHLDTALSP